MRKIDKKTQNAILSCLATMGSGLVEGSEANAFVRRFYPVRQHLLALDPDVVLVLGERGTGKTTLFKAVFANKLLPDLGAFGLNLRLPYRETDRIKLIPGHPIGPGFPDARGLKQVLTSPQRAMELWFAYLVRILKEEIDHSSSLQFLDLPGGAPDQVLGAFDASGNEPLLALDRLDQALQQADQWLFVGYDELDTLGGFDWDAMAEAIKGLVAFWSTYARRWQRLRAKIFLRTDLFRRHAGLGGADLAKLAANRVELSWSDLDIFSMLIKRIANTDDRLYDYCKRSRVPFNKEPHPTFNHIPNLKTAEDARPFIERIVGKYMGANRTKGQSFTWVLDHLRDSHKCATPRSLVRLIEQAAQKERNNPRAVSPALIHPTSLRQALEDVSVDHVKQAENEWPWLAGVKDRVKANKLVPWNRRDLEKLLAQDWDKPWGQRKGNQPVAPPVQNARELIDYLVELGVFRVRPSDRIDVPDIYLFGLGLRRKGGVKRK